MPAFAAPVAEPYADPELQDARASLAYWEQRASRLPRHAVRRRREAREMALRWRARVTEAERAAYGRGLLGALALLAFERRLPEATRHGGRLLVRRAVQAAAVLALLTLLFVAALTAALVELVF